MNRLILSLILIFTMPSLWAQVDTVHFDNSVLNLHQLSSGKNTYLHYMQDTFANAPIYDISIWERSIQKTDSQIIFDWKWITTDSATYTDKRIIFNGQNLKPQQIAWSNWTKGVEDYRLAFDFTENALVSDSDTTKHTYKAMQIPYDYLAFCWELDMETFSTLPLAVGKTFVIPFYHPGGEPPAYHQYKVVSMDKVHFADNQLSAYVLRYYHEDPTEYTDWWIAENSFKVLKMKSRYGDTYRYKILQSL